jgi:hypothetical protein
LQTWFRERSWFDGMKRSSVSQMLVVAGILFGVAATAPFFALPDNIIGVLIIGFAVFQAWRSNTRATIQIKGPLQIAELRRWAVLRDCNRRYLRGTQVSAAILSCRPRALVHATG